MHNKKFIAMMMAFVLSATPVFAAAQEKEGLNQTEPIDVIETNIDETESESKSEN